MAATAGPESAWGDCIGRAEMAEAGTAPGAATAPATPERNPRDPNTWGKKKEKFPEADRKS